MGNRILILVLRSRINLKTFRLKTKEIQEDVLRSSLPEWVDKACVYFIFSFSELLLCQ